MWAKAYQSYVWNCMASAMHESDEETPLDFELPTPGWETNERIRNNPVLSAAAESVLGKDGISIFEKSKSAKLAACNYVVTTDDLSSSRRCKGRTDSSCIHGRWNSSRHNYPVIFTSTRKLCHCAIRELMGVDQGIMLPAFK